MTSLKALDLFSGIGGITIAAEWAGIETVAFVEIDPFCQSVLNKRFPGVPVFGDIFHVTAESLQQSGVTDISIIAGGMPCQPHSVAGKRQGAADERNLWPEFLRLIREIQPRGAIIENVPGLLSSDAGEMFTSILRDLAAVGYDASWGVWGACDMGAPHKRERVFIVGHLADGTDARLPCSGREP